MGHLTGGVHTGVCATGDSDEDAVSVATEDGRDGLFEHPLDGTKTRLLRPAGEVRSVIRDVESESLGLDCHQPSLRLASVLDDECGLLGPRLKAEPFVEAVRPRRARGVDIEDGAFEACLAE